MLIFLALAFQSAIPVTAAAEINCPVTEYGLVPEKLSALSDESSSAADKDSAQAAVRDALVKCAAGHKWSENRVNAAIMHVITEGQILSGKKKYAALGSRTVPYDTLYGYFRTLSFDDRVATVKGESPAADKLKAFLAKSGFRFDGNGTEDDGVMSGTTGDVFAGWIMRDEAEAAFTEDRAMRELDLGER
ncbi:hypothetical protein [Sphingomonas asaccharolytica]|uniref:hypothetical protein n=1 Tax=Sphingomonas asaccharolytica TaxID=40681 RepID=UPI000829E0E5|nr:hypothetical protein [Sphingomonas asaccharolytica]